MPAAQRSETPEATVLARWSPTLPVCITLVALLASTSGVLLGIGVKSGIHDQRLVVVEEKVTTVAKDLGVHVLVSSHPGTTTDLAVVRSENSHLKSTLETMRGDVAEIKRDLKAITERVFALPMSSAAANKP